MGNTSSDGNDMNSEEARFVKSEIEQNCVVVFSKSSCPYCRATKNTFQKMGVDCKVIELDYRSDCNGIQNILQKMTGARTVPRVFISGNSIGGNSEVKKLFDQGKLEQLVKDCR